MIYLISRALIVAIKPLMLLLLARFAINGHVIASDLAFSFAVAAVTTTLFSMCAYKWRFHLIMGPRKNSELTKRRAEFAYLNSIYVSAAVLLILGAALGSFVKFDVFFVIGFALILLVELLNSEDTRDILYSGAVKRWSLNLLVRQSGYLVAVGFEIVAGADSLAAFGLISLIVAMMVSAIDGGRVRDLAWRFSPAGRLGHQRARRPFHRLRRCAVDVMGASSTKLTGNTDKMLYYYFDAQTTWQYAILSYLGSILPMGFDTFRMAHNRSRYLQRGFYRDFVGIPITLADAGFIAAFALISYAGFWAMVFLDIVPAGMHWLYVSLLGFNAITCVFMLASEKLFWTKQIGGLYGRVELAGTIILAIATAIILGLDLGRYFVTVPMLLAIQLKLLLAWRQIS